VIGLADLSGQLIKWAAVIHWIVTKYAIVRAWLFGWLPFHIPLEWHDPIVLFLILLSVTNMALYRETGHSILSLLLHKESRSRILGRLVVEDEPISSEPVPPYVQWAFRNVGLGEVHLQPSAHIRSSLVFRILIVLAGTSAVGLSAYIVYLFPDIGTLMSGNFGGLVTVGVILLALLIFVILRAVYVARRWVLATAVIFGALAFSFLVCPKFLGRERKDLVLGARVTHADRVSI
jgi:hypothetical protein